MATPMECPSCKKDLKGEKIPEEYKHCYPSGAEYYSKIIALSNLHLDRCTHWLCPYCNYTWKIE